MRFEVMDAPCEAKRLKRRCEERSDEAIQERTSDTGLLRLRLAMTTWYSSPLFSPSPPQRRTVRLVLEDDALHGQFSANPIGLGEVARLPRGIPGRNLNVDSAIILRWSTARPYLRVLLQQPQHRTRRDERSLKSGTRSGIIGLIDLIQECVQGRECHRRIEIVVERGLDGRRNVDRVSLSGHAAQRQVEPIEIALRLLMPLEGPVQGIAIVRRQHRVAGGLARSVREHLADGAEVALRFRHLGAVDGDEGVVQPVVRHRRAIVRTLALGDLVLVVRKDEIEPAAMDVEALAQIAFAHGGALDVPAGAAAPPGTLPARNIRRR